MSSSELTAANRGKIATDLNQHNAGQPLRPSFDSHGKQNSKVSTVSFPAFVLVVRSRQYVSNMFMFAFVFSVSSPLSLTHMSLLFTSKSQKSLPLTVVSNTGVRWSAFRKTTTTKALVNHFTTITKLVEATNAHAD